MKKALTIGSVILTSVASVLAQTNPPATTGIGSAGSSNAGGILGLVTTLQTLLDRAVPLIVSLAVIGLFYYLLMFVWKGSSDPKTREDSIKGMGYSILAIFVMVAIWGIIAFIANLVGVGIGGDASSIVPKLTKPITTP